MANENKMQDVIATSLQNIKNLIDTNTVIGTPIVANGTTIIPISKVSMAYATGGLDYAGKTDPSKEPKNFGAGGGTGLTMQPLGFLIVDADDKDLDLVTNLQHILGLDRRISADFVIRNVTGMLGAQIDLNLSITDSGNGSNNLISCI